jgi:hypothetical protein
VKLSVLPTLNDLVLSLDRYDQAIGDIEAGKVEVTVAAYQVGGAALDCCKGALLADLSARRGQVLRQIEACGVELA